jgi:hypothetical protein
VSIDGTSIDSHDFGYTSGTQYHSLSGMYTPSSSGLYTLHIENTRDATTTSCLYNYIDNISLTPAVHNFIVSVGDNVSCSTGGNVLLSISAGFGHGGMDYWVWMSVTGTYPGFEVSGVQIPLNPDALFWWGISNPGFPGSSGFLGKLSMSGSGMATFSMPPDPGMTLLGFPFHFAGVFTSPGPSLPVLEVTNPVHIKYIP